MRKVPNTYPLRGEIVASRYRQLCRPETVATARPYIPGPPRKKQSREQRTATTKRRREATRQRQEGADCTKRTQRDAPSCNRTRCKRCGRYARLRGRRRARPSSCPRPVHADDQAEHHSALRTDSKLGTYGWTNLYREVVAATDDKIRIEGDAAHQIFVRTTAGRLRRLSSSGTVPASFADNRNRSPEAACRHGRFVRSGWIGGPALQGGDVEQADMLVGRARQHEWMLVINGRDPVGQQG